MPVLRTSALSAAVLLFLFPSFSHAQDQKNQKGAGITMAADADAKDIGLPLYPGARRHKDKNDDSPGLNFDLWGGGSGVKLAVLKLESDDSRKKSRTTTKRNSPNMAKSSTAPTHPITPTTAVTRTTTTPSP